MSTFVVDASAALSWILQSQSTPAADEFLGRRRLTDRYVAPYIFSWEVGNVLFALGRRRSLTDPAASGAYSELGALGIEPVRAPAEAEILQLGGLAREVGLSLFDAAYLALATEGGWALVSRDRNLLEVALARNVKCVDLR